jgi:hypothetical protein
MDGSEDTVVAGSAASAVVIELHHVIRFEVFSDHGLHGGLFFTFAPSGKIEHSMYFTPFPHCIIVTFGHVFLQKRCRAFSVFVVLNFLVSQASYGHFNAAITFAETPSACRQSPQQSRPPDISLRLLSHHPAFDQVLAPT